MTRKHLISLAAYVISETATQDPKVGGPISVAEIPKEGEYRELKKDEVEKVIKMNDNKNEKLRKFFFGEE